MIDLLIIGSGPAGLSASVYAKRANLNVITAEKDYLGTGQIAESARVDNYIGAVGMSGYELGEKFRSDAEKSDVSFYEGEAVKLSFADNCWITEFVSGEIIKSRAVIYAAGASHRKLGIPGEEKFGVSYCALCDGALYQGKTVAVIGGGDTALDDAVYLADIAKKVYLIHRRNEFRGSDKSVSVIKSNPKIEAVLPAKVTEIIGGSQVKAIVLDSGRIIPADGVFAAIGMEPKTGLIRDFVELDPGGYVIADETGITKAPGLFIAGDVRAKKLRQVVTAVSDGANAAVSATEYLRK